MDIIMRVVEEGEVVEEGRREVVEEGKVVEEGESWTCYLRVDAHGSESRKRREEEEGVSDLDEVGSCYLQLVQTGGGLVRVPGERGWDALE